MSEMSDTCDCPESKTELRQADMHSVAERRAACGAIVGRSAIKRTGAALRVIFTSLIKAAGLAGTACFEPGYSAITVSRQVPGGDPNRQRKKRMNAVDEE